MKRAVTVDKLLKMLRAVRRPVTSRPSAAVKKVDKPVIIPFRFPSPKELEIGLKSLAFVAPAITSTNTKSSSKKKTATHKKAQRSTAKRTQKKVKTVNPVKYRIARYAHLSWMVILLGFGGLVYSGAESIKPPTIDPPSTFSVPIAAPVQAEPKPEVKTNKGLPKSEPVNIKIASVGIESNIKPVGKKSDGTMETPPLYEHITGWYKHGPTPGEIGPSIIVGHVDTYKGPSVFYRLKQMKPGDIIEVTRADNKVVKFKVTGLQQFEQNENFPTEKVYGNIDHAGIRLITCGGTYNKKTQKYSHNTVVFGKAVT